MFYHKKNAILFADTLFWKKLIGGLQYIFEGNGDQQDLKAIGSHTKDEGLVEDLGKGKD